MELKHWKLDVDAGHLAWLKFDRAGSDTNTFSSEALRELGRIADHLAAMPPRGLAILSAKDNGFAAGADIEEFTQLKDADEAIALTVLGNEVFDKIAALPFPTVAMIHGFCMGGGTELALACKYRVMDDGAKTRMALPEVLLGIVPGWGGAKRMPKLIGAAPALDLMLTGLEGELGAGMDQIRDGLGLGEVDAAIEESAPRELAGLGQARAAGQRGIEHELGRQQSAMAGNLHRVFSRECPRRAQHRDHHLVDHNPIPHDMPVVQRVGNGQRRELRRLAGRPEAEVNHGQRLRTRNPDDRESAFTEGRGDCGDGVGQHAGEIMKDET